MREHFGEKLKETLERKGKTKEWLAYKANISVQTVLNWFKSEEPLNELTMIGLEKLIGEKLRGDKNESK